MKKFRKGSDATDRQAALREIEEQTIALGKKSRSEVSNHSSWYKFSLGS